MNVLIIEDETRAANHLERLLNDIAPDMNVVMKTQSVKESIKYLNTNPDISLIFSDIQLADGLSFEIYNEIQVTCPIIFTTAYDQYAIDAFKTNGIDYLLKPIEDDRLRQAIAKVKKLSPSINLQNLLNLTNLNTNKQYKSRFMVKVGDKIKSIAVEDIKAFYSMERATFLLTTKNNNYIIDHSLDDLQNLVDPNHFFKISRKYIVSYKACSNILAWSNSRLKITIEGIEDQQVVVAREKVKEFKQWLDR